VDNNNDDQSIILYFLFFLYFTFLLSTATNMALGRHVDTDKLIAESRDHPVHKHMGKRSVLSESPVERVAYGKEPIFTTSPMLLGTMYSLTCLDTRCPSRVSTPRSRTSFSTMSSSLVSERVKVSSLD
jgi:hypothetical protein